MSNRVYSWGLWICTILVLLLSALQALTGHWVAFFLLWPGGNFSDAFLRAMVVLGNYHKVEGFAVGILAILILALSFLARSNIYVRVFAVVGFIMTVLAASGGVIYVTSNFQNRFSLGQMADAFVGVFGAYFIQLFFMNRKPTFPWERAKPQP